MSKIKPRVSLVIPAYNEAATIASCIKHALDQTVPFFEIIVVDNNSTDETAKIVTSYSVKLINESKQGIVYARDAGFKASSGDVIARIDADTHLPTDWNSQLIDHLEAYPKHLAVTGPCSFYDFPRKRLFKFVHTLIYYRTHRVLTGLWPLWGSNMAISRKALQQVMNNNYLQTNVGHEDINLTIDLRKNGIKTYFVPSLFATVSLRRGDLSLQNNIGYLYGVALTYFHRGLYARAVILYIASSIGILLVLPFFGIFLAVQTLRRGTR